MDEYDIIVWDDQDPLSTLDPEYEAMCEDAQWDDEDV
jgi:hypothetical protein